MKSSANRSLPVVLVPGRPGAALLWAPLRGALDEAGFPVVDLDVDWDAPGPLVLGNVFDEAVRRAEAAMADSGTTAVHLVGHGLGGELVRRLATSGPLASATATAVTVAARHPQVLESEAPSQEPSRSGGRCMIRRLAAVRQQPTTRWLSYFSDSDQVVPPTLARLTPAAVGAQVTNHLISGRGHLALCQDERLVRSIVQELVWTEGPPGAGAAAYEQAC